MKNDAAAARLDWAGHQLAECSLCPRHCGADRLGGETGWCGAGADAKFFMEYVHYGEEPELVPSHALYLTGCNLGCVFCHTALERRSLPARGLTPAGLAAMVERGRSEGARNLNLLGGEPSVNLPALIRLFSGMESLPPVVWNTNLYCTAETLSMADDLADIYLVDLKFGNDACARQAAQANDYTGVVRSRLRELCGSDGKKVILRHLVLPGHVDCCTRPSLEWVARELPDVRVSLKLDFLVMPQARGHGTFGRFLSPEEAEAAGELACSLGLELVESSVRSGKAAGPPRPDEAGGKGGKGFEVEVVISPHGKIYLHHPTREIVDLGSGISGDSVREEKR